MRILMLHNRYLQRGGEDGCFEMEVDLLRRFGCEVIPLEENNERVGNRGRLKTAICATWSPTSYRTVRNLLREKRCDILHVHNYFPLFSPSVYFAAHAEGVPVVQTLHNYRLMCPVGTFNRAGHVCEDCMGRWFAWPSVVHRCYRDSASASAAVGMMIATNRMIGTWRNKVDAYIVLTEFMRQKFVKGGFAAERLHVKPNFLDPDPQMGQGNGAFALYVGRLFPEKGIGTILRAWEQLNGRMTLKVAGTGPMENDIREAAKRDRSIEYVGLLSPAEVMRIMGEASVFLLPTETYEGHPRVAVEAFARGLPVIASRIGAMEEMIEDGESGLLINPGDAQGLVNKISWLLDNPERRREIGAVARREFLSKYSAERNFKTLLGIYQAAVDSHRRAVGVKNMSTQPSGG